MVEIESSSAPSRPEMTDASRRESSSAPDAPSKKENWVILIREGLEQHAPKERAEPKPDKVMRRVRKQLKKSKVNHFTGEEFSFGLFDRPPRDVHIGERYKLAVVSLVLKLLRDYNWEELCQRVVPEAEKTQNLYDEFERETLSVEEVQNVLTLDAVFLACYLGVHVRQFANHFPSLKSSIGSDIPPAIDFVLTGDLFKVENQMPLDLIRTVLTILVQSAEKNVDHNERTNLVEMTMTRICYNAISRLYYLLPGTEDRPDSVWSVWPNSPRHFIRPDSGRRLFVPDGVFVWNGPDSDRSDSDRPDSDRPDSDRPDRVFPFRRPKPDLREPDEVVRYRRPDGVLFFKDCHNFLDCIYQAMCKGMEEESRFSGNESDERPRCLPRRYSNLVRRANYPQLLRQTGVFRLGWRRLRNCIIRKGSFYEYRKEQKLLAEKSKEECSERSDEICDDKDVSSAAERHKFRRPDSRHKLSGEIFDDEGVSSAGEKSDEIWDDKGVSSAVGRQNFHTSKRHKLSGEIVDDKAVSSVGEASDEIVDDEGVSSAGEASAETLEDVGERFYPYDGRFTVIMNHLYDFCDAIVAIVKYPCGMSEEEYYRMIPFSTPPTRFVEIPPGISTEEYFRRIEEASNMSRGFNAKGGFNAMANNRYEIPDRGGIFDDSGGSSVAERHKALVGLPSAAELHKAGMEFIGRKGHSLNVEFKAGWLKGTLYLPTIEIENATEALWRNLLVYEEDKPQQDFCYYMILMDVLIDSAEDVKVLKSGSQPVILGKALGCNEDVAKIFNDTLLANIYVRNVSEKWRLTFKSIYDFHNKKGRKTYWEGKETYCGKPWLIISMVVATILLIMTVLQTYYTVAEYYHSDRLIDALTVSCFNNKIK